MQKLIFCLLFVLYQINLYAAKTCSKCNYRHNSESASYCLNCAQSFEEKLVCPHCGFENTGSDEYCLSCTKSLDSEFIYNNDGKSNKNILSVQALNKEEKVQLAKRFKKDYKDNNLDHYSVTELLHLMQIKGSVKHFVKAGTSSSENVPSFGTYISTVTMDHYKDRPIIDAAVDQIRLRCHKKPSTKFQIFSGLLSHDSDIRASSAIVCASVKSVRNSPGLPKKMIRLLKDRNPKVVNIALGIALKNNHEAMEDPNMPHMLISIAGNQSNDPETRKSAIYGMSNLLIRYKDFQNYLARDTKGLTIFQEQKVRFEANIKVKGEERKRIPFSDYEAKKKLEQTIRTERKNLEETRKKISETKARIRKYEQRVSQYNRIKAQVKQALGRLKYDSVNIVKKAAIETLEDIDKL